MWKVALISLAAVLCTAQGYYERGYYNPHRGLGVPSWDQMLAELMQQSVETGVCGERCYIEVNGEKRILEQGERFVDGCTHYTCARSGVREETLDCQEAICDNGVVPIRYPNQCCQVCEAEPDEPGEFEEWGEWTECSRTCGGGARARRRTCKILDGAFQVACTGRLVDTEDCNTNPCPIDCIWEYGDFEECSTTCGPGVMKRFPEIIQHPMHGGMPCPPEVEAGVPDERPCNNRECSVPCEWEWGEYSRCSRTCGGGTRERFPIITRPAEHGGFCPLNVLNGVPQTDRCSTNPCPVPCEWEWGEYGRCSRNCGGGTRERFPIITRPAEHGGFCPLNVLNRIPESDRCNTNPCPVPCEWEWSPYGECSKTCGGGRQRRVPVITREAMHDGFCPDFVVNREPEERDCNTMECPMVCDDGEAACLINGEFECIPDCDGDCIPDTSDNCKCEENPDQEDMDGDTVGDECDNCIDAPNEDQENSDGDLTGNVCDIDDDNDGRNDAFDNCPRKENRDQRDSDEDGVGDVCDNCPSTRNTNQNDRDGDGVGNACDRCRFDPDPTHQDPAACVNSAYAEMGYDDDDGMLMDGDKKSLAAEIMEKLLEMYYSN